MRFGNNGLQIPFFGAHHETCEVKTPSLRFYNEVTRAALIGDVILRNGNDSRSALTAGWDAVIHLWSHFVLFLSPAGSRSLNPDRATSQEMRLGKQTITSPGLDMTARDNHVASGEHQALDSRAVPMSSMRSISPGRRPDHRQCSGAAYSNECSFSRYQ
jgi:hypothetical protein